jgi:hypothetical protein
MEPKKFFEVLDVRDEADSCNRYSPEDDQGCDETDDCHSANDALPPRNFQRLPNNFIRINADISWRHYIGLVKATGRKT